jgi:hypothetical protein
MINRKFSLSVVLYFLHSFCLIGQCDGLYNLCSQSDVDSFLVNNSFCEDVDRLVLVGALSGCNTITDLSPLLGIKSVNRLFIEDLQNCKSLDGLDSLQRVGDLSVNGIYFENYDGLRNLKIVDNLSHIYYKNSAANGISDLSMYVDNIVEITERLSITGDTKFFGFNKSLIPSRSENSDFVLNLRFIESKNDFTELMPSDIEHFSGLVFQYCNSDSLSLRGLENIQSYRVFTLIESDNLDLSQVSHMTVDNLNFIEYTNDVIEDFPNVVDLKNLNLIDYNNLETVDDLLPNLESVSGFIRISDNADLTDISILNDFELPHKTLVDISPTTRPYNIMLTNNPELDSCNLDLFCRALHEYPDSILIENNGIGCTLDEVKRYCQTVSVDQIVDNEIQVYPNPATDLIKVYSTIDVEKLQLLDATGKVLYSDSFFQNTIDVGPYEPGNYTIRLYTRDAVYYERIIILKN